MSKQWHISPELAERLKELGYKEAIVIRDGDCIIPTQDMLCRWLRETQGIDILVDVVEHWIVLPSGCYYRYRIYKKRKYIEDDEDCLYESYDHAVAAALWKIFTNRKRYKIDYGTTADND